MAPDRRSFLRTLGAVAAGGLFAGCQSSGDGTVTESPATTATPTTTPDGPEQSMESESLQRRAREFVQLLADGEFDAAHSRLTDRSADALTVDRLRNAWNGTAGQNGTLQAIPTASYEGRNDNGRKVVVVRAQFTGGPQQFAFGFTADGIAAFRILPSQTGEWTPPAYADRSSFSERTLTLDASGECSLGATLTMPEGEASVPGVVLVHGNGAQDRDQTVGPNKTFKDISWGLASRGIAVLRYDKRTYACDVDKADLTIDDVVTDDALAAIDRLRAVERVSERDIFVAGHSFGGLLAPRIAARDGNLAGAVMLAPGPARPISEAVVDQTRHLATLDGTVTEAERQQLEQVQRVAERIRTLDIADDEVLNGLGGREFYRTLREYDHSAAVRQLSIPRYIAQGGQDWQVTVEEDLPIWRDALAGEKSATIEVYPDLNHRFQVSTGKETAAEYREPDSHVAERLVVDVAGFVETTA